jgi:hypothetical protein
MPAAVVLFAKAPLPGRVKTRLTPPLSAGQAAEFHRACAHDTWRKIESLAPAGSYFFSDTVWDDYSGLAAPGQRGVQRGADLGARMLNCFQDLHERGHSGVLIVGSDSPTLPREYLEQGLRALEDVDAVLGPTEDGGYYAIGCRRTHPQLLHGVEWSSPETLRQTEANLRALGLRFQKLPLWYDVDTAEDLKRLANEAALPPSVGAWVETHRSLLA